MTQRCAGLVAYPKFVLLDLAGPCDVFWMANRAWDKLHPREAAPYKIKILSTTPDLRAAAAPAAAWAPAVQTARVDPREVLRSQ